MPYACAVEDEDDEQRGDEAEPCEAGLEIGEMARAARAAVFIVGSDWSLVVFSQTTTIGRF